MRIVKVVGSLVLGLSLAMLLVLLLINARDESLDPNAAAALKQKPASIKPEDNLFFSLLGFAATGNAGINALGQKLYAATPQDMDSAALLDPFKAAGIEQIKFIGERKLLCTAAASAVAPYRCIETIADHQPAIEKMLIDNRLLLNRYAELQSFTAFENPYKAGRVDSLLASWATPIGIKSLRLSKQALVVNSGNLLAPVSWLNADTRYWRQILASPGLCLIDKIVAAASLRNNWMFISELIRLKPLDAREMKLLQDSLQPLTLSERSLGATFRTCELKFQAAVFMRPASSGELAEMLPFDTTGSLMQRVVGFLARPFYKPVASLNRSSKILFMTAKLADSPCTEFVESGRTLETQFTRRGLTDYLFNPVGNRSPAGSGLSYVARMCDLEGIQRLVALQLFLKQNAGSDEPIPLLIKRAGDAYADPYSGKPIRWDERTHSLTFDAQEQITQRYMPWPI